MARHNLGKKINVNGTLDDLGNTVSDEDLEKIDSFVNSGIEEVVNAVAWNLNEGFYIAKGTLTIGANTYIIKNTTNPAITTSNGAVLIYVGKGVYVSSSAGTYKYLTIYNGYTSGTNELIVTFDFTQHGQIWLYDNGTTGENFDKFPSRKQYSVVTNISVVNNRVRVLKDGQVSYLDDIALTSDIPTDYVTFEESVTVEPQINELLEKIYPIGSIYMSVNGTSPASFLGGTWERIQDRFLLGAGSSYSAGSTGGEATHTLTVDEMPAHTHAMYVYQSNGSEQWEGSTGTRSIPNNYVTSGKNTYWEPLRMQNKGGGQPFNNMPPYLAVYMWKRTG